MDLLFLKKTFLGLFFSIILATVISKLRRKRFKLPPSPFSVPIFGNWLQVGDDLNHLKIREYAKKLGDIFLLKMGRRNLVIVSSLDLAKEVLHTQGIEFGSRWRGVVWDIFTEKGQDMALADYGEHWKTMRRITAVPFFSRKVVQENSKGWQDEVEEVIKEVKKNPKSWTEGIVLRSRLHLMMYNNTYRVMFNKRFESEDDPLFIELKKLNGLRSSLAQSFEYNYGDFISIFRPFLRGYLKICKNVKEKRLQLFKHFFVYERKKLGSIEESMKCGIDYVLESQQRGEINEDQLLLIVENINVAAIETTLWSIEWAIAELINSPDIQKKLHKEIDKVLGPGVPITESDIVKLPYLEAVIKETLRFRMVTPFLVPHTNLNNEKLDGYDIPAKSKMMVNAWWLANNPAHWKKPEEFRPERFLEEESHVDPIGNDLRYIPFGAGRRSCPGILMALSMFGITLGNLVQNFELLPPPGQAKIDITPREGHISLIIKNNPTVIYKSRSL